MSANLGPNREPARADETLREQREQLRITLSRMDVAVLVSDTEGVTFLNPVAGTVTARHTPASRALAASEVRYRRLFETAQDAILILDGDTGRTIDANPFLSGLLGYARAELLGKELWEIGLFQDIEANRAAFRRLQENGYIRYEDLPLATKDGRVGLRSRTG
jgi:PAS domain S-box-containing protein